MKKKFLKRLPDLITIVCFSAFGCLFSVYGGDNAVFFFGSLILLGVVSVVSHIAGYRDGREDASRRPLGKVKDLCYLDKNVLHTKPED